MTDDEWRQAAHGAASKVGVGVDSGRDLVPIAVLVVQDLQVRLVAGLRIRYAERDCARIVRRGRDMDEDRRLADLEVTGRRRAVLILLHARETNLVHLLKGHGHTVLRHLHVRAQRCIARPADKDDIVKSVIGEIGLHVDLTDAVVIGKRQVHAAGDAPGVGRNRIKVDQVLGTRVRGNLVRLDLQVGRIFGQVPYRVAVGTNLEAYPSHGSVGPGCRILRIEPWHRHVDETQSELTAWTIAQAHATRGYAFDEIAVPELDVLVAIGALSFSRPVDHQHLHHGIVGIEGGAVVGAVAIQKDGLAVAGAQLDERDPVDEAVGLVRPQQGTTGVGAGEVDLVEQNPIAQSVRRQGHLCEGPAANQAEEHDMPFLVSRRILVIRRAGRNDMALPGVGLDYELSLRAERGPVDNGHAEGIDGRIGAVEVGEPQQRRVVPVLCPHRVEEQQLLSLDGVLRAGPDLHQRWDHGVDGEMIAEVFRGYRSGDLGACHRHMPLEAFQSGRAGVLKEDGLVWSDPELGIASRGAKQHQHAGQRRYDKASVTNRYGQRNCFHCAAPPQDPGRAGCHPGEILGSRILGSELIFDIPNPSFKNPSLNTLLERFTRIIN
jgi:hypothetical protein